MLGDLFVVRFVIFVWGALLGGIVGWWWRNETIPPRPLTLREKLDAPLPSEVDWDQVDWDQARRNMLGWKP